MSNLQNAKARLILGAHTCVLCKGETVYTSNARGVKPLVSWLDSDISFSEFSAADKVVGKGAGFLYVLLGVREVYADVISRSALSVLQDHGIYVEYNALVDNIINRKGDGICPFEAAVLDIEDKYKAYEAIKNKMLEFNI